MFGLQQFFGFGSNYVASGNKSIPKDDRLNKVQISKTIAAYQNYLLFTSKSIILYELSDFLKDLSKNSASEYYISEKIPYDIPQKYKPINAGASGVAYDVGDYVVKITNLCNDEYDPYLKNMCKDMQERGNVIAIPNSFTKKSTLLVPNNISESVINIILNERKLIKTGGFPEVFGFQYDNTTNPMRPKLYISMEKLESIDSKIYKLPHDESQADNFFYIIFQLAFYLEASQRLFRFNHNDLHLGNIMTRRKNPKTINVYKVGGRYMYTLYNFETVIIDFGWGRLETDKYEIIPKINFPIDDDLKISENIKGDNFNYFEYNPYYDMVSIFMSFFTLPPNSSVIRKNVAVLAQYLLFEYKKMDLDIVYDIFMSYKSSPDYWRPDINKINRPQQPLVSLYHFLDRLCRATTLPKDFSTKSEFINYMLKYKVVSLDHFVEFKDSEYKLNLIKLPERKEYIYNTLFVPVRISPNTPTNIDDTIRIEHVINPGEIDDVSIKTVNRKDPAKSMIDRLDINQYIHIAYIDETEMMAKGYTYSIDCCRINSRELLRDRRVISGISVSASIFDKKTYLPYGFLRTKDTIYDTLKDAELLEKFKADKDLFGVVGIERTANKLIIFKARDVTMETVYSSCDNFFTCGPLLLYDSVPIANYSDRDSEILKDSADKMKLMCENKKLLDFYKQTKYDNVEDCDNVKTDISKFYNSFLPKNIFAMNTNVSPYVKAFMYIEGSNKRGTGLDIKRLTDYLLKKGFTHAVCLDQGEGAEMYWAIDVNQNKEIYQANIDHNYVYPVGATLSIIKYED